MKITGYCYHFKPVQKGFHYAALIVRTVHMLCTGKISVNLLVQKQPVEC